MAAGFFEKQPTALAGEGSSIDFLTDACDMINIGTAAAAKDVKMGQYIFKISVFICKCVWVAAIEAGCLVEFSMAFT